MRSLFRNARSGFKAADRPVCSTPPFAAGTSPRTGYPDRIYTGRQGKNHIQGIAVDEANGLIYYSFTTRLVKSDLNGNILGSAEGLAGHLGCIAFCPEDGRVYGSLEFKKDSIGEGILDSLGDSGKYEDGFYIAVFDVDRITREGMNAETDGIMRAAYLEEVTSDYNGTGVDRAGKPVPHRYGCSGIDGLCFAPKPGETEGPMYLWVAYGVYGDTGRDDNDHQVLLRMDRADLCAHSAPLAQNSMHREGPSLPPEKYFVLTGNTSYGVQNLEYDPSRCLLLMAVYPGSKTRYPNYGLYAADLTFPAQNVPLSGLAENGGALTLFGTPGPEYAQTPGWKSDVGQFGIHMLSDGRLYVAEPAASGAQKAAYICLYTFDTGSGLNRAGSGKPDAIYDMLRRAADKFRRITSALPRLFVYKKRR